MRTDALSNMFLSSLQIVGIDAEFVALTAEETELRLDGTNVVRRGGMAGMGGAKFLSCPC